jgi:hypothetical protein
MMLQLKAPQADIYFEQVKYHDLKARGLYSKPQA